MSFIENTISPSLQLLAQPFPLGSFPVDFAPNGASGLLVVRKLTATTGNLSIPIKSRFGTDMTSLSYSIIVGSVLIINNKQKSDSYVEIIIATIGAINNSSYNFTFTNFNNENWPEFDQGILGTLECSLSIVNSAGGGGGGGVQQINAGNGIQITPDVGVGTFLITNLVTNYTSLDDVDPSTINGGTIHYNQFSPKPFTMVNELTINPTNRNVDINTAGHVAILASDDVSMVSNSAQAVLEGQTNAFMNAVTGDASVTAEAGNVNITSTTGDIFATCRNTMEFLSNGGGGGNITLTSESGIIFATGNQGVSLNANNNDITLNATSAGSNLIANIDNNIILASNLGDTSMQAGNNAIITGGNIGRLEATNANATVSLMTTDTGQIIIDSANGETAAQYASRIAGVGQNEQQIPNIRYVKNAVSGATNPLTILQGGNSFTSTDMTIGTNNAQSLILETTNVPRVSISPDGRILGDALALKQIDLNCSESSSFSGATLTRLGTTAAASATEINSSQILNCTLQNGFFFDMTASAFESDYAMGAGPIAYIPSADSTSLINISNNNKTLQQYITDSNDSTIMPKVYYSNIVDNAILQNGNSFSAPVKIGSNDVQNVVIESNNNELLTFSSIGSINTTTANVPNIGLNSANNCTVSGVVSSTFGTTTANSATNIVADGLLTISGNGSANVEIIQPSGTSALSLQNLGSSGSVISLISGNTSIVMPTTDNSGSQPMTISTDNGFRLDLSSSVLANTFMPTNGYYFAPTADATSLLTFNTVNKSLEQYILDSNDFSIMPRKYTKDLFDTSVLIGGNSPTSALLVGTNNGQNFILETNALPRLNILSTGSITTTQANVSNVQLLANQTVEFSGTLASTFGVSGGSSVTELRSGGVMAFTMSDTGAYFRPTANASSLLTLSTTNKSYANYVTDSTALTIMPKQYIIDYVASTAILVGGQSPSSTLNFGTNNTQAVEIKRLNVPTITLGADAGVLINPTGPLTLNSANQSMFLYPRYFDTVNPSIVDIGISNPVFHPSTHLQIRCVDGTALNTGNSTNIRSSVVGELLQLTTVNSTTSTTSGQLNNITGSNTSTGNTGTLVYASGSANTGSSGNVFLLSGTTAGASGSSGGLTLSTGACNGGAVSGAVTVSTGNSTGLSTGNLNITSGTPSSTADGGTVGSINLTCGTAQNTSLNRNGGNVTLTATSGKGTGSNGNVNLFVTQAGSGVKVSGQAFGVFKQAILDTSLITDSAPKTFQFQDRTGQLALTTQQVFNGGTLATNINAAQFIGIGMNALETHVQFIATTSGVVSSFSINVGVAPGVGNNRTFTLRKNAVATAFTATVADANRVTTVAVTGVTVVAGDLLAFSSTATGAANSPCTITLLIV